MSGLQLFDDLPPHIEAALTESIKRFGVLVPVAYCTHGVLLDGHHRVRIAESVGVDCARVDVRGDDGDECGPDCLEMARTLNSDRRHLTDEQRRKVAVSLRQDGHSLRAIAGALGTSKDTVARDLDDSGVSDETPDEVVGLDGKSYPASRPKPGDRVEDSSGDSRTITAIEAGLDGELILHDDDGDCLIIPDDYDNEDEEPDGKPKSKARTSKPPTKPDLDGSGLAHPARYTDSLLPVFSRWLPVDHFPKVLDPFAGTGKIHQLPNDTTGVEIEPELAGLHPDTIVGDALHLPFADATFDAICTSPTYGNRLADSHNASDPERRRSYTHDLGRPLSDASSGAMQWGPDYRQFHADAWAEAIRVLRPGGRFILNIKDHVRNGTLQLVSHWHVAELASLGLDYCGGEAIPARNLNAGANADLRTSTELVFVFRKPEEVA